MSSCEIVYDLIGLGFGPANIAIAAAVTERWAEKITEYPLKNVLFLEKHAMFCWHPGMLLPEAKMQISFMKDLVTLRNPQSSYSFLSYLHSQGRLVGFINRGSTIPSRKEYADYLSWAAKRVQDQGVQVLFGHEVVGLQKGSDNLINVRYRNLSSGVELTVATRNIVISPGGSPKIPASITPVAHDTRVVHSSSYATSIDKILSGLRHDQRNVRVAVIGSGQSAAEVALDLRSRLSGIPCKDRHQVDMLIHKGALKPSDDSPFQNEIFDPSSTDSWFHLPSKHVRDMKFVEYKPTNYGVVNPRTLETLYEVIYDQRLDDSITHRTISSTQRSEALINIKPYTTITSANISVFKSQELDGTLLLSPAEYRPEGEGIYATGYERLSWVKLLKNSELGKQFGLQPEIERVELVPWMGSSSSLNSPLSDAAPLLSPGDSLTSSASSTPPTSPESNSERDTSAPLVLKISRAYQLMPQCVGCVDESLGGPRVYLQGVEEFTHGLSDTLLSVLGVRAGEVVADLENNIAF